MERAVAGVKGGRIDKQSEESSHVFVPVSVKIASTKRWRRSPVFSSPASWSSEAVDTAARNAVQVKSPGRMHLNASGVC